MVPKVNVQTIANYDTESYNEFVSDSNKNTSTMGAISIVENPDVEANCNYAEKSVSINDNKSENIVFKYFKTDKLRTALLSCQEFVNYVIKKLNYEQLKNLVGDKVKVPEGADAVQEKMAYKAHIRNNKELLQSLVSKLSDTEINNWVEEKFNLFAKDPDIAKILQKYPQYKKDIVELFIESGCNSSSLVAAIKTIFEDDSVDKSDSTIVVSQIVKTMVLRDAFIQENLDEFKNNNKQDGLFATLGLDIESELINEKGNRRKVINALRTYIEGIDEENRAKEIIRLLETSNSDEQKLLKDFIMFQAKKDGINLGDHLSNFNSVLKVFLGATEGEWDRIDLLASIPPEEMPNLSETTKQLILEQFDKNVPGIIKSYNISYTRLDEIIKNLKEDPSYISKCSDTEKEFIEEIYPVLQQLGINADIAAATSETMTDDEKQTQMAKVHNVYREHLGEAAYRDVITGVYNYIQELQEQGIELNISYEKFAELMNAATNRNYELVMNDILRGDGVETALNMEPVQPREGGNESASAYNPETGMFNVPDGDPYAAGDLAQQLNQLYTPSLEDTLPKPVQENHTASTTSKPSIISFKEWQEAYYSGNTTKALKDIVSNNVVVTSQAVVNKVIEQFKNFDKTIQSNILAAANCDWFGRLLDNTKVSALKGIFASGGFIGGIYRIQQANDRIKEEEAKKLA